MRILLVHNYYRWRGGEDEIVDRLAGALRARGQDVEIFAAHSADLAHAPLAERLRRGLVMAYSLSFASKLRRAVTDFRPDVAHVWNVFPLITPAAYSVLKELHVPVAQTINNFRFVCPNGLAFTHGRVCFRCEGGNTIPAIAQRCLHGDLAQSAAYAGAVAVHRALGTFGRCVDRLLAVNAQLAGVMARSFPGIPASVFPVFVDVQGKRPREGPGESFVYLGRLSEEKGLTVLVEAARRAPELKVEIVGDGPLLVDLRRGTGANVRFHGFLPGEARFALLKSARALVMPSLSHDACPAAVIEAMALGVPVIATRMGGLPDLVIDGETGVLTEAGDALGLVSKMRALAADAERARRMGEAARRRAELEFDVEVYCGRVLAAYRQTIDTARAYERGQTSPSTQMM